MPKNQAIELPEGFVLDERSAELPAGFILDQEKPKVGIFGKVPVDEYQTGKRNIVGNIFERPAAASRAFIQAPFGKKLQAYEKASINPTGVPKFQDLALDKYYGSGKKPSLLKTAGGFGVSAAGMAADIATDPSALLSMVAGKAPVGPKFSPLISKQVGRSRQNLGEVTEVAARRAVPAAQEAAGKVISKVRKSPEKLTKEATTIYRDILRPTQGEIKNVEIKKGQDINKYYKLAAEEGIRIKQTPDNKLDTAEAVQALRPKIQEIHEQLNSLLRADKKNKFDLMEIGDAAKKSLRGSIQNAEELTKAERQVNKYIAAEIKRHGQVVNAETLNNVKQGMWSVGYDALKPTAKSTARKIGNIAKEKIERAFPAADIRGLNAKSGEYLTLTDLLENAQGRVVKGGRLGHYVANVIGAVGGSKVPVIGPLAGAFMGGKVAKSIYDPARLSAVAVGKMKKATARAPRPALNAEMVYPNITGPSRPALSGPRRPEALPPQQPKFLLPSPEKMPYRPTGQRTAPGKVFITPKQDTGMGPIQLPSKTFQELATDARAGKFANIKSSLTHFKKSSYVEAIKSKAAKARMGNIPSELKPLALRALKHKNVTGFIDAVVIDKKSVNSVNLIDFYNFIHGKNTK